MSTVKVPHSEDVARYVEQVRGALGDLPPDDVEDLTGGLEADLAELAAESPHAFGRLGSPESYAAELRSSAGLPLDSGDGRRGAWRGLAEPGRQAVRSLRARPWVDRLWNLAGELRPVGWVVRGAALGYAYVAWTDNYHSAWWIGSLAVVVSVALGLSRWRLGRWSRRAVTVTNIAALAAVIPMVAFALAVPRVVERVQYVNTVNGWSGPGLVYDGQPVGNLFPYGSDGKPLRDVRILDDTGRHIDLGADLRNTENGPVQPVWDVEGRSWQNAFPLTLTPGHDPWVRVDQGSAPPQLELRPLVTLPTPETTGKAGTPPPATTAPTPAPTASRAP